MYICMYVCQEPPVDELPSARNGGCQEISAWNTWRADAVKSPRSKLVTCREGLGRKGQTARQSRLRRICRQAIALPAIMTPRVGNPTCPRGGVKGKVLRNDAGNGSSASYFPRSDRETRKKKRRDKLLFFKLKCRAKLTGSAAAANRS